MKSKGFTLIELLVVIAIIGLLAGIVLVSLGGARDQAKDVRITTALTEVRTKAELLFTQDGNYGAVLCILGDADIAKLCDDIAVQGGGATIQPAAPTTAYCAYSVLNQSAGDWYCVDSNFTSVKTTTDPSGLGFCDGTTLVCP